MHILILTSVKLVSQKATWLGNCRYLQHLSRNWSRREIETHLGRRWYHSYRKRYRAVSCKTNYADNCCRLSTMHTNATERQTDRPRNDYIDCNRPVIMFMRMRTFRTDVPCTAVVSSSCRHSYATRVVSCRDCNFSLCRTWRLVSSMSHGRSVHGAPRDE